LKSRSQRCWIEKPTFHDKKPGSTAKEGGEKNTDLQGATLAAVCASQLRPQDASRKGARETICGSAERINYHNQGCRRTKEGACHQGGTAKKLHDSRDFSKYQGGRRHAIGKTTT